MILVFGLLSDYIGRRKMFLTGMAVLALFAVPYFMLVTTSNIWLFLLGGLFILQAFAMWRDGTDARAVRLYRYSITYLTALFALIILDVFVFLPL